MRLKRTSICDPACTVGFRPFSMRENTIILIDKTAVTDILYINFIKMMDSSSIQNNMLIFLQITFLKIMLRYFEIKTPITF